jgi:hypothetical protein
MAKTAERTLHHPHRELPEAGFTAYNGRSSLPDILTMTDALQGVQAIRSMF